MLLAHPLAPRFIGSCDSASRNVVHLAAGANAPSLRALLASDLVAPLVNRRDSAQDTPLQLALTNGNTALELIRDQRVSVNLQDRQGRTPLHSAVSHHNADAVRMLLARGAITLSDADGRTPMDLPGTTPAIQHLFRTHTTLWTRSLHSSLGPAATKFWTTMRLITRRSGQYFLPLELLLIVFEHLRIYELTME
eukprot:m.113851 g.113851  ORF g.113851 m.113851 type:complete len:194 (-) comp9431_c0_seq3:62-643(-)